MAEARCANPACGRTFYKRTGQHRFCTPVCRERARPQTQARRKRYSYQHQKLREQFTRQVAAGGVACARCGERIVPGEPWDLDHADESDNGYLGPSHRACNRATSEPQPYPEDEPENGIYWGPPSIEGRPFRWSRPWFDWR